MNQIINIVRKDVRRLRLELIGSLSVLLLYALVEPGAWRESINATRHESQLAAILNLVLFLVWAVLILRLIHGERLAGANQFWTTRPYEWPKLLAAKASFLLLFLYAPLLVAQIFLLHAGGAGVASNVAVLLRNLVQLTATFVLPLACIAAVTVSFSQTMVSLVGIAVGVVAIAAGFQYAGTVSAALGMPRRAPDFLSPLQILIAAAIFAGVVFVQYSRRTTRRSIAILGVAATLLIVIHFALVGSSAAAAGYPAASAGPPVSVAILPAADDPGVKLERPMNPRTAVYGIPLTLPYGDPKSQFIREAMRYTLTAADGYTWSSSWIENYGIIQVLQREDASNKRPFRVWIDIPWPVHDRLVGGPVSLSMEFLVAQVQEGGPYVSQISAEDREVPGLGACALDGDWKLILCRVIPGRSGSYFRVSTFGSHTPCPGSPDRSDDYEADATHSLVPDMVPVSGSVGIGFLFGRSFGFLPAYRPGFVPLGLLPPISPVDSEAIRLSIVERNDRQVVHLCPGQPLTFTRNYVSRRFRVETQTATIVLKDQVAAR